MGNKNKVCLPKSVTLCDWKYKLLLEHNPTTNENVSTVCWGVYDGNVQVIKVNESATVERAQETIVHEVLHAIDDRLLFGEDALGEKRIIALAHGIRSLIRNNPKLIKFLKL